jgi:hypothetical protein
VKLKVRVQDPNHTGELVVVLLGESCPPYKEVSEIVRVLDRSRERDYEGQAKCCQAPGALGWRMRKHKACTHGRVQRLDLRTRRKYTLGVIGLQIPR